MIREKQDNKYKMYMYKGKNKIYRYYGQHVLLRNNFFFVF